MNLEKIYFNFLKRLYKNEINLEEMKLILSENNFANGIESNTTWALPLYIALENKNFELANILLKYGADVNKSFGAITNNFIYGEDDEYSLNKPIISHLICAESDDVGSEANSLKEATKMLKNTKRIEFLIKNNCNINNPSRVGFTPLDETYGVSHIPAIKLLKKHGAKYSKRFIDIYAAYHFKKEQIEKLEYIDIPYINKKPPPFHLEIQRSFRNHKKYKRQLEIGFLVDMENQVDKNQKDWKGRTPLDFALEIGHHVAVDYLRSVGAKTAKELEEDSKE